jgi:ferritin-like metal-binding protein YciE
VYAETVHDNVEDMLAVETELHQMLRHQKEDGALQRYPNAQALIQRIEDTTDRNLGDLRACAEQLGGQSALKKAVGAAMGVASGLWQRARQSDSASRIVRDAYGGLSFAVVCYEMLHTTALAAGDTRTAELALRNMKNYAPLIIDLTEMVPEVVVRELAAEGKLPNDERAAAEAVRNARNAWQEAQASV